MMLAKLTVAWLDHIFRFLDKFIAFLQIPTGSLFGVQYFTLTVLESSRCVVWLLNGYFNECGWNVSILNPFPVFVLWEWPFTCSSSSSFYFRHFGALGNVQMTAKTVNVNVTDDVISLDPGSDAFIGGRAFNLHALPDDFQVNRLDFFIVGHASERNFLSSFLLCWYLVYVRQLGQGFDKLDHDTWGKSVTL